MTFWLILFATIVVLVLMASLFFMARSLGRDDVKLDEAKHVIKEKDKQLEEASKPRATGAGLLERMRKGRL